MKYLSKKDLTILLGNTVDHFDTSLYVFLAPVLAPLFFPNSDPVVSLIMAYSILATSMVTRPIGTYIFGMIAKIHGPTRALSYSLIGVGLATLMIGLLPSYSSVGIMAPFLLIIFRIFRGVFAAGESAIAKLYILQDKKEKEAFRGSYLYQTSTILGITLASLATTFVHYIEFEGAWRMCFILGGISALIGYFLRKISMEIVTKDSKKLFKFYSLGGIKTIWVHKIDVLRIAIANSFSHLTYVIPFVTMNHLVPLITDIELKTMMAINSFMLAFDMFTIPFVGRLVARFEPKSIMVTASSVLALTIIPIWYFIEGASIIYITFVRFWIVIWGIVFLCPLNLWCRDQVEGDEKYIVVGMGTTLGATTIGKLTPAICLSLYHVTGSYMTIAVYIACMFLLSGIAIKSKNWQIYRQPTNSLQLNDV